MRYSDAMDSLMSGSSHFIGSAVTIPMFRELCPVITGPLLAGRAGSTIAAETGTMKVTGQTDALRTLAAGPVQYLPVPRFIGCLVMTPVLTLITDVAGVLGGAFISFMSPGITLDKYVDYILNYTDLADLATGLVKSVFSAWR